MAQDAIEYATRSATKAVKNAKAAAIISEMGVVTRAAHDQATRAVNAARACEIWLVAEGLRVPVRRAAQQAVAATYLRLVYLSTNKSLAQADVAGSQALRAASVTAAWYKASAAKASARNAATIAIAFACSNVSGNLNKYRICATS
jgi:hypothetical protein